MPDNPVKTDHAWVGGITAVASPPTGAAETSLKSIKITAPKTENMRTILAK
ncbi:MAG: hypothetical protein IPL28_03765 [Chloroflexi bacterium]|nr:hypothetical protein [Chloroflexota bacterium]